MDIGVIREKRMGCIYHNKFGTPYRIIEYIDSYHVVVEFLDNFHAKKKTESSAAYNGDVKNPYDKSVCGIAFMGEGKYRAKINRKMTRSYQTWMSMIQRCYYTYDRIKYKAYYHKVTVCDDWLNYQKFSEWYEQNEYECEGRLHLDKDILVKGSSIYSSKTCLLVPQRINMLFMDLSVTRIIDTDLPSGIKRSYLKDGTIRFRSQYNTHQIGTFDTFEEALEKYNAEKRNHIREVAEEYKDKIPDKVYDALMNW